MAIAFDNATSSIENSGTSPQTFSHTVTGTNLYLIVGILCQDSSGNTISGVTYNGVSMTLIAAETQGGSATSLLYGLVAPATGANNVVVSVSSNTDGWQSCAVSYTGVLQTGSVDASAQSSGAGAGGGSMSVTTTVANDWVIAAKYATGAATTNCVLRSSNGIGVYDTNSAQGAAGSKTIVATDSTPYAYVITSLKPFASPNTGGFFMAAAR